MIVFISKEIFYSLYHFNIRNILDDVDKDVDTPEEDGLIEEFIMIVEQDGGVGHRTEADSWDADLPEIPGVGACRKYLGLHSEIVCEEGCLHGCVPGILVINRGESLVSELDDKLQLDITPGLFHPATNFLLELDNVRGGRDPDVKVEDEFVRHHVDLDPA